MLVMPFCTLVTPFNPLFIGTQVSSHAELQRVLLSIPFSSGHSNKDHVITEDALTFNPLFIGTCLIIAMTDYETLKPFNPLFIGTDTLTLKQNSKTPI